MPAVLLQRGATEGVEEDLQSGVGADLVEGLALVLEDLFPRDGLGPLHAELGRAVHVFHQVAGKLPGEQGLLLVDEGTGGGIGQVLDGLAAEDRQLAPAGVPGAELAIGVGQVVADQAEQQRLDLAVFEQLHFQAVFEVDQAVADVVRRFHQVDQRMTSPALVVELRHAELMGDLLEQRQPAMDNLTTIRRKAKPLIHMVFFRNGKIHGFLLIPSGVRVLTVKESCQRVYPKRFL